MHPRTLFGRPVAGEYGDFFAGYVAQAPDDDIVAALESTREETVALLSAVSEQAAGKAPALGEWSIKEVVGHLCDTERIFSYRLLRLSRFDATPLPPFEQDEYVAKAHFNARPLNDLLAEYDELRRATVRLVASLTAEQGRFIGTVSGVPTSTRAMAWVICGHNRQHLADLRRNFAGVIEVS
jgi:uncharacterized damage-inducible protein DinB